MAAIGLSMEDPDRGHLVYHELRYSISGAGDGSRKGIGDEAITPVAVPDSARLTAWVQWSQRMRDLPAEKQRQIVQGIKWGLPSTPGQPVGSAFRGKYTGEHLTEHGGYAAGPIGSVALYGTTNPGQNRRLR